MHLSWEGLQPELLDLESAAEKRNLYWTSYATEFLLPTELVAFESRNWSQVPP
jgi:hypothetical protein